MPSRRVRPGAPPARGTFPVQAEPCATCIYRKESPLDIRALEAQVADPHLPGFFAGYRICHHSGTACCRGFWNRHRDEFTAGQLAQRLGLVEYVRHDTWSADAEGADDA